MKAKIALGAAVALAAIVDAHAATVSMTPELQALAEAAKKDGALVLSSSPDVLGGERAVSTVRQEIKEMFGVDLDIRFVPGVAMGATGQKIMTEFRAGQKASTDVWAAGAPQAEPILRVDMFHKVDWAKLLPDRINPSMVEGDGRALKVATGIPGVLYNVKAAPWAKDIVAMEDLLKPELKGKFGVTPFLAAYDVLLSPSVWGEAKTIAYIKKLSGQAQGLLGCDTEDRIASGEFAALALDCAGTGPNKRPEYEGVLAVQVVSDNAQRRPYYALIPKNARNPEAAKLYTVYLATEEGQRMLRRFWGFDLADFPGSFRNKQVAALEAKGVKFRDITISWWEQQDGIAEAVRRMIKEFTSARR